MKRIIALLLALVVVLGLTGCAEFAALLSDGSLDVTHSSGIYDTPDEPDGAAGEGSQTDSPVIDAEGWYYSADDVALYLHTYAYLPDNFITKSEARELGWEGGSVEQYAPGYAIGGDIFGNREGLLPEAEGRTYYECDIDTDGQDSRGAKRLVFSNDGLIYYTDDHYESFTLLYGEETT